MEKDIPDNQTTKSKHNVYNDKVCAYCGKQEGPHWAYHCKTKHDGLKKEWDGESELIGTPWCSNWREVHDGAKPANIHPSYKKGFKQGNNLHTKRSTAGSAKDSLSVI